MNALPGNFRLLARSFEAFVPPVWCLARPTHLATKDEVRQAVEVG
jgi:hypothetical protein